MKEAKFITFEGGEGSGKSTQVQLLQDLLQSKSIESIVTREPGGSKRAEAIRSLLFSETDGQWDPLTEAILFSAARRDHILQTILPALKANIWVISDRFYDSTLAYQSYAGGLDAEKIRQLHLLACDNFQPDITFILDVPVAVGLGRAANRQDNNRFEDLDIEFHTKVANAFREIHELNAERCQLIDACADIDTVAKAIGRQINLLESDKN